MYSCGVVHSSVIFYYYYYKVRDLEHNHDKTLGQLTGSLIHDTTWSVQSEQERETLHRDEGGSRRGISTLTWLSARTVNALPKWWRHVIPSTISQFDTIIHVWTLYSTIMSVSLTVTWYSGFCPQVCFTNEGPPITLVCWRCH